MGGCLTVHLQFIFSWGGYNPRTGYTASTSDSALENRGLRQEGVHQGLRLVPG
jgi:hypothetical protein